MGKVQYVIIDAFTWSECHKINELSHEKENKIVSQGKFK